MDRPLRGSDEILHSWSNYKRLTFKYFLNLFLHYGIFLIFILLIVLRNSPKIMTLDVAEKNNVCSCKILDYNVFLFFFSNSRHNSKSNIVFFFFCYSIRTGQMILLGVQNLIYLISLSLNRIFLQIYVFSYDLTFFFVIGLIPSISS